MLSSQEPKYDVNHEGRLVNRASGEVIPDDEPVMVFRARDRHVADMIAGYRDRCCQAEHREVVEQRYRHFVDFAAAHPERMKEPDTAPNDKSSEPAAATGSAEDRERAYDYATNVFLDLTDCVLATVEGLAMRSCPPMRELSQQCAIAQRGVDAIQNLRCSTAGTRAETVIVRHEGRVDAYAAAISDHSSD